MVKTRFTVPYEHLSGRGGITFLAETDLNGTINNNCEVCVTPLELLFLTILLSYRNIGGGLYTIDIVLQIENRHTLDIDVDIGAGGDFDLDAAGATWLTTTTTVPAGETDTTITGELPSQFPGTYHFRGFVTGDETPAMGTPEPFTSNTDLREIVVP